MSAPPLDPAPILDLIEAFRRSKTMFAALELGVFDGKRPSGADGKRPSGADGKRPSGADGERPAGAEIVRLLDACVSLGLLEKRGGEYINTPVADEYLRRSSPRTLSGYIRYSNNALYPLWEHLEDAVREGTHRWEQSFGPQGGTAGALFSHFFKTESAKRDFLMGMHGFGILSSPKVAAAFDLSRFSRMVDLGGATGHLALAAKDRYPELRVALFDLPEVIEFARSISPDHLDFVAGDFFNDPLPPADLYAIGRILHDWSEDKIRLLLGRIHAALPADGALLIAERLIDEDRRGPVGAHMQSLNMLVCTEGRERTLGEYTALLREAGFAAVRGRVTGAPLDAVLGEK
jgi:acetylserotonin N-methyltransferase